MNPHVQQRQQNAQKHRPVHCRIKPAPIAHLTHIDQPFRPKQKERKQQKQRPDALLYPLLQVLSSAGHGQRFLPSVRLRGCLKAHHIALLIALVFHPVYAGPFGTAVESASVHLRPGLQGNLLPGIADMGDQP